SFYLTSHRAPHKSLNPTHLRLTHVDNNHEVEYQSRRARKGRYTPKPRHVHSSSDTEFKSMGRGKTVYMRVQEKEGRLKAHLTLDISFWIAVLFTFGSAVWVVNGFLVWFPILRPNLVTTAFTNTAAAFAFIGGSVFEIGSYLMVVEALDRGRETDFGTALGHLLHSRRRLTSHRASSSSEKTLSPGGTSESPSPTPEEQSKQDGEMPDGAKRFVWWGKPLWRDMGYIAAIVQLFAASIFWISTLTGLPGAIPGLYTESASVPIEDVFFWTPQVIGGSGFIISSLILMVEVQTHWWLPRPFDIGWQVAFWNLIGSLGFTLCGAFGYSPSSGLVYQSALSTFWGSWAFLIGSVVQTCEAVWRESPD
ncbi:hypothetical protein TREMEDRAFT_22078, partial [Tremella mesenterica DSM 1558]|uniref:uncharacterized protein n=1 Tax=Tremella mesenterica (strain ATCC 24925 / CBS 8224 / DSM 1558 / NBRC 9311 / NRRL Y-6157 / RJB 2259-6 / UBC 559-6) TaxID=578456 RepID=UPI0003F49B08